MNDNKDVVRMNVATLVAMLQKMPQDANVLLMVNDPSESAFSPAVSGVHLDGQGFVQINADVWSDDEDAHAQWADHS